MNPKIAIFPGSFDPFTIGHHSIIERALPIFDKIIISIGINQGKKTLYSIDKRVKWIKKVFEDNNKIEIKTFKSLTVEYARNIGAKYLLRGLRTATDFEYERQIGQMNKSLCKEIESVYFLTLPEHTFISSTIVKEIIKYKGDVSKFLPDLIAKEIHANY